ncbi:MAG TPA: homocysteine S-methyltransferase family protein [Myxococcales bacterium]|nr:homocysteine S-methyltransferase family protein [Myxococcales bacterium]
MAAQVADSTGQVYLLDGAVGTELGRRGVETRGGLFSAAALLDERGRAVLREVHRAYVEAGADVITAATFRTNRRALTAAGLAAKFPELARVAVHEARSAAAGRAWVAGSLAPVEDCYRPDLRPPPGQASKEHLEHARALAAAGCDLLLVETVAAADEGLAAVAAAAATGLPVWVAAMATPQGTLLDGSDLKEFFRRAVAAGAEATLVNCTPPDGVDLALSSASAANVPFGAYAHLGAVDPAVPWGVAPKLSPDQYADRAASWIERGATIVGGCCGTTPAHIAALAARFRSRVPTPT